MDADRARLLRDLLDGTPWVGRTAEFARALRGAGHRPGGLLLVGTPLAEPWHLAAHLDDEARIAGVPELAPILVRHQIPVGAPAHLAVDLARLEAARRGETVFVVAPDAPGEGLLQRVHDARRTGATVLALELAGESAPGARDAELRGLAHDTLTVLGSAAGLRRSPGALTPDGIVVPADPAEAFATAAHLVSLAAGETTAVRGGRRGFRDRLARVIDVVSGPAPAPRD